jgi:type IV pilus assembly protein PilM
MSFLSFLNQEKTAFGLDMSELSLKLAKLKRRGGKVFLESWNEIELPIGLIIDGEITDSQKIISLIHKLIKNCHGKKIFTKEVVSVLPEPKTFLKLIEIPISDEKKLASAIKEEIERHIPLPADGMYLDWKIINNPFYNQDSSKIYALVGASPKFISNQYTELLDDAGLNPIALEIEGVAIARSLTMEETESIANKPAKVIIDFGATRTGLVVYDHGTIQFSLSIPISGEMITKAIASGLDLGLDEAEKIKIACGLDKKRCQGSLGKILHDHIDDLATNIRNAISFYYNHFTEPSPVDKIIICGGGANFRNLDKTLSHKLDMKVDMGNPLQNISTNQKYATIPPDKISSYTTAIGLALRGMNLTND